MLHYIIFFEFSAEMLIHKRGELVEEKRLLNIIRLRKDGQTRVRFILLTRKLVLPPTAKNVFYLRDKLPALGLSNCR